MIASSPLERRKLLESAHNIAVVGASAKRLRPSYLVYRYLLAQGFDVKPVNPAYAEIDGAKCYPSLRSYADECGPPDIVDVFRKASQAAQVAREAVEVGAKAIWFQYGVISAEANALADAAGLVVVVDRCIKVDHALMSAASR